MQAFFRGLWFNRSMMKTISSLQTYCMFTYFGYYCRIGPCEE
jgi:hypothetical protein